MRARAAEATAAVGPNHRSDPCPLNAKRPGPKSPAPPAQAAAAADPKHTEVAKLLAEAERDLSEKRAEDAVMRARQKADDDRARAEAEAAREKERAEKGAAGLGLGPLPARKAPAPSRAAPAAAADAAAAGLPRVDELMAAVGSGDGDDVMAAWCAPRLAPTCGGGEREAALGLPLPKS